jgi:putative ATP-dependent endonuclease of OLD family
LEEPENHLSHTSLRKLLGRIEALARDDQQLFVATHSSFVLNRLGLDSLILIADGRIARMSELSAETVNYFKKLPGYDTLRMVLADRFVLVEGPSDEILFERFYSDATRRSPMQDGIDVISVRGLSLRRCLEVATILGKRCAALTDNDGKSVAEVLKGFSDVIDDVDRRVFVGGAEARTLEPHILAANPDEAKLRRILKIADRADVLTWMTNNKTEAAIKIAASDEMLAAPGYFTDAIEFIRVDTD